MSNDLTLTKTFQEKMFERIRENIGELMSDDDLKRLVDSAVQKAFFEPMITKNRYGDATEMPPVLVGEMSKLMKERVDIALKEWVASHPDEIEKIISEVLSRGITGIVTAYFDARMWGPLQELANKLREKNILL